MTAQQRRKVTVRVHGPAVFLGMAESIPVTGSANPPRRPTFYFVKVTNEGLRDVVVTHVWVDGQPRVDVLGWPHPDGFNWPHARTGEGAMS